MKILNRKRVMSFLLALAMFASLIPGDAFKLIATAVDSVTGSSDTNYGAAIGSVAEWDVTSVFLASNHYNSGELVQNGVSPSLLPEKLTIVDYAYDDVNAQLWYKVDAAPGYTWPEEYYHWVYDYAVKIVSENGMTGVFDADGKAVSELTLPLYDKVTLSAESSLQGSVKYQWQIEYEEGKWVDIYGQNKAQITISIGMLATLLTDDSVNVRCVSSSASKTAVGDSIAVTVDFENVGGEGDGTEEPAEPKLDVKVDGVVKENITLSEDDHRYFEGVLSASSTLTGTLTYKWDIYNSSDWSLMDDDAYWKQNVSNSAEFAVSTKVLSSENYTNVYSYKHWFDSTRDATAIRVSVSNGETTLTKIFYVYFSYETTDEGVETVSTFSLARTSSANSGIATVAEETTTTYNVIINYLNADGTAAVADSYTSVVSPTTILTNTISFPKITGYVPMVYDQATAEWVRQDTYTFDGTPFTADFILNVRYYPDAVDYKVNIYIQNAENDEYTLMTSYVRQELTGTVLDEITFNVSGYYQSKFSSNTAAIAADGSTEFNLYYDRIYYLMKFDLDGGYGVQPIYARHGVKLDIPNPTKAGYTFVGWDQTDGTPAVSNELLNDGNANTMYAYMPIGNSAYKAIWEAVDNAKVTIVYWGENPNDEGYSYLESQELYVKPGTELTFGTDQLVCTLTEHTHGSDCTYNCGKTPHTHSLDNDPSCYTLDCDESSHNHAESNCTLNCTHTHVLSCYAVDNSELYELRSTDKPDEITNTSGNGIYTYTTSGFLGGTETHYYLYLDGTWYCAIGKTFGSNGDTNKITLSCTHGHTDVCYSCGLNEGTHVHSLEQNCYTLTCQTQAHTHSADCYSCIAHTHTDDCYLKTDREDSTKYYYVRSDTVTVAADGTTVMNVYYDRVEYAVEFHKNQDCTNEYTNLRITAKWGASILNNWPTYNGSSSWLVEGKSNTWQNSIQIMPIGGAKFWGPKSGNSSYKAYYYTEALPGDSDTITYNGVTYVLHHTDTSVSSGNVTIEEQYGIEGFKYKEGTNIGDSYSNAKFYYVRESYSLEFNNGEGVVKSESVKYQYNLGSYAFTPTAPSYYEAGSVEFAGWYQNPECTGAEVKLDETTMPATNMILYAKWVPVKHDVTVYRYRDADGNLHDLLCNHTDEAIGDMEALGAISHGELLNKHYIPEEPTNGNYSFVTWAYYDEDLDKEITIDINSFMVTKDVEIYAKWSSNVQVDYVIRHMIQGTTTEIVPATEGKYYAGETQTFYALNVGEGYFPLVTSHSIDFHEGGKADGATDYDLDYNATTGKYEYTFYYVAKESVSYTVYYVTGTPEEGDNLQTVTITENGEQKTYYVVAETKNESSKNAIVTENFAKVNGYMPDAYQKTLILDGSDGAVNQIIFKYSINTTQAYYKVTHWTQQTDGYWFAHSTYENIGTIGDTINENPMTIDGFTYLKTTYKVGENEATTTNAPLTADGLEIDLYYTRNKYPYTVEYREQGTNKLLYTVPNLEDQYYGATVEHTAPEYYGTSDVYKRVSAEKLSTVIQTDATKNVITFYYVEREVTIKYEVLNGFGGTVNPSQETVLISTGTAQGSTAEALSGYKFLGWYDVNNNRLSTELTFTPAKVNGLNVTATYYAKFEEIIVSVKYEAETGGSVSRTEESTGMATGAFLGSTATANTGYTFIGWYYGNTKVSDSVTFVPNISDAGKTFTAKFKENEATIKYEVVGPDGCGTVGLGSTNNTGVSVYETIGVVTGNPAGSTAAVSSDIFKFVGWYVKDAKGNYVAVTKADGTVDGNKFTPTKADDALWVDGTTYYAKFEYNLTGLTIEKKGHQGIDSNQTFIFEVVEVDEQGNVIKGGVNITVTVHENGSVTIEGLTVGKYYRITEKTDWSWRYGFTSADVTSENDTNPTTEVENVSVTNGIIIKLGLNGEVTFTNSRNVDQWLDGDAWCDNLFNT